MTPIKVLLVEDSSMDATLIQGFLGQTDEALFEVQHVETLSQGLEQLHP